MENNKPENTGSQAMASWPHPYDAAISNGNFRIGQFGHTLTTIGSHTGHAVAPVAFCAREGVAKLLLDAVMQREDLLEALESLSLRMPAVNAPCHNGLVDQSECGHCQRIARGIAAIAKARGES